MNHQPAAIGERRAMMKRLSLLQLFVAIGLLPMACDDGAATTEETTVETSEGALLRRGAPFPNAKVRVCWELAGNGVAQASSNPNFANLSRWVREEVENGWGAASGLTFTDWTDCPTTNFNQLSGWVAIHFESCKGGNTSIGFFSNQWTRMRLDDTCPTAAGGTTFNEADFRAEALHEFGHALGFDHEVNRDDRPADDGCLNQYPIIPGGVKVTNYDVKSIMDYSYCSAASSRKLTPWDTVGIQAVYGRKHTQAIAGVGGRCVNIPNASSALGTPLQIFDCVNTSVASNDRWARSAAGNLNATLSGGVVRSINVPNGDPNVGLTIWSDVESSVNEHFDFKGVELHGLGGLCVTSSQPTNGAVLRMVGCDAGGNSKWDWEKIASAAPSRNNRFRLSGTNFCINVPNAVAVNGEGLQLFACGTPAFDNELFSVTSRGEIKTLPNPSALCMSGENDNVDSLNRVVSATCGSSTAKRRQQFNISGPIKWAGDNGKCMDVANAVSFNGAALQLHSCVAGARNELWDYYF